MCLSIKMQGYRLRGWRCVLESQRCCGAAWRQLAGSCTATRRDPGRNQIGPLNSTRTLQCGTLFGKNMGQETACVILSLMAQWYKFLDKACTLWGYLFQPLFGQGFHFDLEHLNSTPSLTHSIPIDIPHPHITSHDVAPHITYKVHHKSHVVTSH